MPPSARSLVARRLLACPYRRRTPPLLLLLLGGGTAAAAAVLLLTVLARSTGGSSDVVAVPRIRAAPVNTEELSSNSRQPTRDAHLFSLTNHSDPIIALSQNTNQAEREQFQRNRVRRFCERHKRQRRYFAFPPQSWAQINLFDHLLFSDGHKVILCHVEQVQETGCNELAQTIIQQSTGIELTSGNVERVMNKASFSNISLTPSSRRKRLKTYYKTMIVRNPLERILSSYLNLVQPPLTGESDSFPDDVKMQIMEQYRSAEFREWIAARMSYPLNVTFPEFIEYLTEQPLSELSPHFLPATEICHPCRILYDFYGASKLCHQDSAIIRHRTSLSTIDQWTENQQQQKQYNTEQYLVKYYSLLSNRLKKKLMEKWYVDLDFYYHLYPEERNGHKRLLNIRQKGN